MLKSLYKVATLHAKTRSKDLCLLRSIGVQNIQTDDSISRKLHSKIPRQQGKRSDEVLPRTNAESSEDAKESIRLQKIKQAMQTHLKNLQLQTDVKTEKQNEFEIGRRHLANMMGADPNTFTQDDINKAIEYLMPSGLFETRARPIMKPPDEIDPPIKGGKIDSTGRPENMFFYTGKPELYSIYHDIYSILTELNDYEDKMIKKGFSAPPPETKIFLGDSEWILLESLKECISSKEKIDNADYAYLIEGLERLVEHPYSFRAKNFIMKYRKLKNSSSQVLEIPPLTIGEDGVPYVTAKGSRKYTRAQVTVRGNGSGKVLINGIDISYFPLKQDREQLLFPLKFSGLLNQVDFEATLTGEGGSTAEAGAIRHGLSKALASFVSPERVDGMRIAGLMNRDVRRVERKKPGQKGARAKYKWRKR